MERFTGGDSFEASAAAFRNPLRLFKRPGGARSSVSREFAPLGRSGEGNYATWARRKVRPGKVCRHRERGDRAAASRRGSGALHFQCRIESELVRPGTLSPQTLRSGGAASDACRDAKEKHLDQDAR